MTNKNHLTNEQAERYIIEQMWLNYYNEALFKKGLISEAQHHAMIKKISNLTAPI